MSKKASSRHSAHSRRVGRDIRFAWDVTSSSVMVRDREAEHGKRPITQEELQVPLKGYRAGDRIAVVMSGGHVWRAAAIRAQRNRPATVGDAVKALNKAHLSYVPNKNPHIVRHVYAHLGTLASPSERLRLAHLYEKGKLQYLQLLGDYQAGTITGVYGPLRRTADGVYVYAQHP